MSKPVIVLCAVAGGLLAAVGVAALGAGGLNFDYAAATEQRQQKFLDGVAKGFEAGFQRSAKGSAEIERIKADSAYDTISVDIRFKDPNAEHANGYQVEAFRKSVYVQNCRLFASRKLLDAGVKMKLRMRRPSGGVLTNLTFDSAACAQYLG